MWLALLVILVAMVVAAAVGLGVGLGLGLESDDNEKLVNAIKTDNLMLHLRVRGRGGRG